MTHEEEHAIQLFIKMVAELNDSQEELDKYKSTGNVADLRMVNVLSKFIDTFRAGETQEDLNALVLTLVEQQEV